MSLGSTTTGEVDEVNLPSTAGREDTHNNVAYISKAGRPQTSVYQQDGSSYLSAPPPERPGRPLSPDALSVLSTEEFEHIRRPSSRSTLSRVTSHANTNANIGTAVPHPRGLRARLQASWIHNKGLFLMLVAQFFGVLMNVATRILEIEGDEGRGLHPFQIIFVRMGVTFLLASSYMYCTKTPDFPLGAPEVRWLLFARGFCGFFGVFGMYYSLLYLPLADATVITFLAPGLACWVCSKLINEPFTRVEMMGTGVSLIGVLFIARPATLLHAFGNAVDVPASGDGDAAAGTPPSDAGNYDDITPMQRLQGVGVALIGVFGAVGAYTTIRWIGKRAHPLISVNYFAIWCTIVSMFMQVVIPSIGFLFPSGPREWGLLFFLGICGFVMQFLLATALSYEKSSRTTNMVYTQMLFALGFDKLIFGHSPDVLSILGSSLILGSAIVVAFQKSSAESKEQIRSSGVRGDEEEARRGLLADVATARNHD